MAWVNVFDVGSCAVALYEEGPGLIPEADYASRGITVTTVGGVVSVAYDTLAGALSVYVIPSVSPGDVAVRLGTFRSSGVQLNQCAVSLGEDTNDFTDLAGSADAYTPDPVTYAAPGEWDRAWVNTMGGD